MARLKTYRDRVERVLREHETARNSDGSLIAHYINTYHSNLLTTDIDGDACLKLKNIKHLPPLENIRRSRAIIQNDNGLYPPTDPDVIEARGIKERNWREVEVREAKSYTQYE